MPDPEPPIRIAAQERPAAAPSRLTSARTPTITRTAVLAVHGMGQQLQFDTLETVAAGLRPAAMRAGDTVSELVAGSATAGAERLQRVQAGGNNGGLRGAGYAY